MVWHSREILVRRNYNAFIFSFLFSCLLTQKRRRIFFQVSRKFLFLLGSLPLFREGGRLNKKNTKEPQENGGYYCTYVCAFKYYICKCERERKKTFLWWVRTHIFLSKEFRFLYIFGRQFSLTLSSFFPWKKRKQKSNDQGGLWKEGASA